MGRDELDTLYRQLRAHGADEVLDALFALRRLVPDLDEQQRAEAAAAVATLFYLDVQDRPEMATVVDQAIRILHSMGPELIPLHLEEMRGSDFKALFCFARVLALFGAEAVAPIIDACAGSDDAHLLVGGIYALTKIRDRSILQGLDLVLRLSEHSDSEVRDTAIRALGKFVERFGDDLDSQAGARAYGRLLAASFDPLPSIRAKAVRGLGKMAAAGMLDPEQKTEVGQRLDQVLGQSSEMGWDQAFIVRREAAEAAEHLAD
ncbi:MAG TPA: hypothetical protein ENK10_08385 [Acidobacteria bacterium]|nr:hypothetical protein [Acidobacteriota bacterium]